MDFKNLTIYNFYNLISTMMKYGYEKNYPDSPGMTQEELRNFFVDFNPIGVDMGWFTRDRRAGSGRRGSRIYGGKYAYTYCTRV